MSFLPWLLTWTISTLLTVTIDGPPLAVQAADHTGATPVPLVCLPVDAPNTVQFLWRTQGDVAALDQAAIEQRLHRMAEEVNGLFARDSDLPTEMRLPRWQTTADCLLDVGYLTYDEGIPVPATPRHQIIIDTDPEAMARNICGYALIFYDTRTTPDNLHNGSANGWVKEFCLGPYVVAHEFLHTIGAVQFGAPHQINGWHANDNGDIMSDSPPTVCGYWDTIDCGHDDYFSLNPRPGSYLATSWNSADSVFLVSVPRTVLYFPLIAEGASYGKPQATDHRVGPEH